MTYTQLAQEQRYQIYGLKRMTDSQTEIAKCLGVHRSTISRELKRNQGKKGYRPKQAHQNAVSRRKSSQPRITEDDWRLVEERIRFDLSPEQGSNDLKKAGLYEQYEQRMMQGNLKAFAKDIEQWAIDHVNSSNTFVTEAGDTEDWKSNSNKDRELLENVKKYLGVISGHIK